MVFVFGKDFLTRQDIFRAVLIPFMAQSWAVLTMIANINLEKNNYLHSYNYKIEMRCIYNKGITLLKTNKQQVTSDKWQVTSVKWQMQARLNVPFWIKWIPFPIRIIPFQWNMLLLRRRGRCSWRTRVKPMLLGTITCEMYWNAKYWSLWMNRVPRMKCSSRRSHGQCW